MKTGWHFENLLQRGLLMCAMGLPNGAPEFRYVHHEIIEESQHTLMFQELVNRSQLPVRGMPRWARILAEVFAVRAARYAPATFFVFVLGGEDPVDHLQREELRHGRPHPLVERSSASASTSPRRRATSPSPATTCARPCRSSGRVRRHLLAVEAPLVMALMTRMILVPPRDLRRHCGLPAPVARAAMRSPEAGACSPTRPARCATCATSWA